MKMYNVYVQNGVPSYKIYDVKKKDGTGYRLTNLDWLECPKLYTKKEAGNKLIQLCDLELLHHTAMYYKLLKKRKKYAVLHTL